MRTKYIMVYIKQNEDGSIVRKTAFDYDTDKGLREAGDFMLKMKSIKEIYYFKESDMNGSM